MSVQAPSSSSRQDRINSGLRVLFALPGLHRVSRGAELALESVAHHLTNSNNFRVTMVGSGTSRPDAPYEYKRAGCISREHFERWPSVPYLRGHYAYEELTFAPGLWQSYSPEDFDATVTCGYPYTSWILRHGRSNGTPRHIFVTQNGDWMATARNWEFKHFSCDGLICVNPEHYERHRERWNCALIPNGVNTNLFHPGPGDREKFKLPATAPIVLMVAALIPSKRVLEGIRAVAHLDGVHLAVAGDGDLRASVAELGRSLLGERFHQFNVTGQVIPELYRCADAVLHMSMDESFGNVYIEALATGLPVIAHETQTTRWILEDLGQLIDTRDEQAVVKALQTALASPRDAATVSRISSAARRFAWSEIAARYGEFIRDVCSSNRP